MTRVVTSAQIETGELFLPDEQMCHYLLRVRRLRAGAKVVLTDGTGRAFEATLQLGDDRAVGLAVGPVTGCGAVAAPVHLLVAPPKGRILDDVVKKVSEMGVARLTPVICRRSQFAPSDNRVARWRKIAISAQAQSRRAAPLVVDEPIVLAAALAAADGDVRFVMHPGAEGIGRRLGERINGSIQMLVGPEGGLTESEVAAAGDAGFLPVGFGRTIMRIETAAMLAAMTAGVMVGNLD